MKTLEESTKWVPSYALVEKTREEEAKIRKEAVKEAKDKVLIKTAKNGLKEGLSVELISKLTGLKRILKD